MKADDFTNVLDRPGIGIDDQDKNEEKIDKPSMYKVLIHNDDYTPFELVTEIIQKVFHLGPGQAFAIMLHCHLNGIGLCGIFPKNIAETKVQQACDLGKIEDYALMFSYEKED